MRNKLRLELKIDIECAHCGSPGGGILSLPDAPMNYLRAVRGGIDGAILHTALQHGWFKTLDASLCCSAECQTSYNAKLIESDSFYRDIDTFRENE